MKEQFRAGRATEALLAQAVELVRDVDAAEEEKAVVRDIQARCRLAAEERRKALIRQQAERREAEERERAQLLAAAREVRERRERAAQMERAEKLQPLTTTVRGALKKAAREGRTTTWPDLKKRTGHHQLGRLNHQDKIEVLLLVESATRAEDPLWSVLLAAEGDSAALQLYRDVSHRLGRPLPVAEARLKSRARSTPPSVRVTTRLPVESRKCTAQLMRLPRSLSVYQELGFNSERSEPSGRPYWTRR